jgi:YcxB-like protein
MLGKRELELTPEGVKSISTIGESFYKAEAIWKVTTTPDVLLLYISELQAIIIPRAKLSTEEWCAAKEFAQAHYGLAKNE